MPRLVMMSGLPGSGKSTLSKLLAERTGAELLRIDVFEQDLRNQHGADFDVGTRGYRQGYRLAARHLREGRNVIADAVRAGAMPRQHQAVKLSKSKSSALTLRKSVPGFKHATPVFQVWRRSPWKASLPGNGSRAPHSRSGLIQPGRISLTALTNCSNAQVSLADPALNFP